MFERHRLYAILVTGTLIGVGITCSSTVSEPNELASVAQNADGCGANRFMGSASVMCISRGTWTNDPTTFAGTCVGDNQVVCTFSNPNGICAWNLDSSSSTTPTCYSGTIADFCSGCPPEASLNDPSPYTVNLVSGDTTCDPVGTAAQLSTFCRNAYFNDQRFRDYVSSACYTQYGNNECGIQCCQNRTGSGSGSGGSGSGGSGSGI